MDIELVIKMPEELKEALDNIKKENAFSYMWVYCDTIYNAIKNGIPLPKGHGRLVDEKESMGLIAEGKNGKAYFGTANKDWEVIDFLKTIPTIIEADKESEDKE